MIEHHEISSTAVGDTFHITAATCGDDPRTTLVVTDADGLIGLAVDTIRLMQLAALVPPMLVVGIGYPGATSIADTIEIRARDLTPTATTMFPSSGGADAFLRFIADELCPWLSAFAPGAADDLTFFGHSLGGLFGTWVMLTRPEVFNRYILSSPSLWWDRELLFGLEEAAAADGRRLDTAAVMTIGSLETDDGRRAEGANLPDDHPAKPPANHLDMVDDLRRFVAQLAGRRHPHLDLHTLEFADEYHLTVPAVALSRSLRHFFERRTRTSPIT